ncbi:hypothetical protein C9E88_013575 [Acinetobacter cumulans]|nr:hypothetical protein C9E88_013575 [Acinetobacter cumulans]
MFITSFEEQNITYRSCSNLRIHLYTHTTKLCIQPIKQRLILIFKIYSYLETNYHSDTIHDLYIIKSIFVIDDGQ